MRCGSPTTRRMAWPVTFLRAPSSARAANRNGDPAPADRNGREAGTGAAFRRPNPADPATVVERETLKLVLQFPRLVAPGYPQVHAEAFTDPAYAAVHTAVTAAGGPAAGSDASWVATVADQLPAGLLRSLVTELAVEPLRHRSEEPEPRYAGAILARMAERVAAARERDLASALRRAEAAGDRDRVAALNADLSRITAYRRALSDRARGAE